MFASPVQELLEKHRALSQDHYSKMDALEEAYQVITGKELL